MLPLQTREECAYYQQGQKHESRAQVGLLENQSQGQPYDEPCLDQILERELIGAYFREEARNDDDYNQFDQFRHLEKFAEDGNPALGAEAGVAEAEDGDERDNADEVEDGRLVKNKVVVEPGESEHQNEADDEPADLFVLHAGERATVGSRIDLDHAES